MPVITKQEKFRFWKKWIFQHTWAIPVSYLASLIVILIFCAIFGISMKESGTQLEQLVMQIAGGSVLGLGIGLIQRLILKQVFNVQRFWIWSVVIGFIIAEAVTGFICWRLKINRMELRFIELNALPESLIFAFAGLLIGLLQWSILRKYFRRGIYWIFASCIGWGICIIVNDYSKIFTSVSNSSISILTDILAFLLGATIYGALTGATLMWILKKRQTNQIVKPIFARLVAFILRWL
jgi:predicted membrane protein